jgi:glycosyltransferase involved in cell wall biosynthesis
VPWALSEPDFPEKPDDKTRADLFGDAGFGLLYSGTIAKAHQFEEFILLARELRKRKASIKFCFAGRGNCFQKLKNMVTPEDSNIAFAGFVEEKSLSMRLAAADMHMISLREGWEGIEVPSKFFGSIAAGKPLLYCGASNSCIARWIREAEIGFIVTSDTIGTVADSLIELSHNPKKICQLQDRSFRFYNMKFSRKIQCMNWDKALRNFIKESE